MTTSTELTRPERFFQDRFGMDGRALERGLGEVLGRRVDYADLYFEYRINEVLGLEEGIVRSRQEGGERLWALVGDGR